MRPAGEDGAARDKVIYIENLTYTQSPTAPVDAALRPKAAASAAQLKGDNAPVNQLRNADEAASDDDGWAPLATVDAGFLSGWRCLSRM